MNTDVLLGLVPSMISLAGIIITAVITNSLVKYRVEQLEKKGGERETYSKPLCTCPRCNKMINETPYGFFCETKDCSVKLFKSDKYLAKLGISPDDILAKELILNG